MCGIAGYLGTRELEPATMQRCLARMRRRGPDQQQAKSWSLAGGKRLHLLFARLSIIDLDARANQPLEHDRRWIIFNGELYNYLERRDELVAQGAAFRTTSDTEVMVQAIARQGWGVLDR